jgi:branched-chain amino acid transport system substrate-binding protein
VDLLLGSFSSFLNLPASAVAERNKMLYVETAGGSPEMFERGFKYLFFTQNAIAERQADLFAEWVTSLPEGERPKTAGFLTIDDPFTKPVIVRMKKLLEEAGIKTLLDDTYPPDTTNFDSVANSIKSKNPDVLVQGAVFNDGVGLVRSLIRVGYQPKQFFQTTAPTLGDQYSKAIGLENTEGIFSALSWDEELTTDGNADFVAAYEAMFEGTPPEDAAAGFANAQVVQAAVEAVGNVEDQTAMADWLRTNEVSTILGPLTWDEAGRPQGSYILAQWQDGESDIVAPADLATTDTTVNVKPEWKK